MMGREIVLIQYTRNRLINVESSSAVLENRASREKDGMELVPDWRGFSVELGDLSGDDDRQCESIPPVSLRLLRPRRKERPVARRHPQPTNGP